jgi:hypothetical protein
MNYKSPWTYLPLNKGLFGPSGAFSQHQFSVDYTITMFGFDFRQGQAYVLPNPLPKRVPIDRGKND